MLSLNADVNKKIKGTLFKNESEFEHECGEGFLMALTGEMLNMQ